MSEYNKITYCMVDNVYPMVEQSLNKNLNKYKNAIADFINYNHEYLYDVAPCNIIYHRQTDVDNLFKALGFTENDICDAMRDSFFWNISYHPRAAKEPYVIVLMMAIRYFLKKKMNKEAELTIVYLAFSGMFYASLYRGKAFPSVDPSKYRAVMDYVVNNMLTNKHDLKIHGNVFGAIRSQCNTILETYKSIFLERSDDKEYADVVQQIRDREKSWLMNIAKLYYKAKEDKLYLNMETDNLSDTKEFRITDNDSLKATRYTQNTVNYLVSNTVSLQIANKCKDSNVKATEIKDIMESLLSNKDNLEDITRVTNILICDFMKNNPDKSINSIDFISHSIKTKPNTKDAYIIELKDTMLKWLDENSPNFRKRKSRIATKISYQKALLMYITLAIVYANK